MNALQVEIVEPRRRGAEITFASGTTLTVRETPGEIGDLANVRFGAPAPRAPFRTPAVPVKVP